MHAAGGSCTSLRNAWHKLWACTSCAIYLHSSIFIAERPYQPDYIRKDRLSIQVGSSAYCHIMHHHPLRPAKYLIPRPFDSQRESNKAADVRGMQGMQQSVGLEQRNTFSLCSRALQLWVMRDQHECCCWTASCGTQAEKRLIA